MHVVSETPEQDVAHAKAFPDVEWALRELTANLMRVAAGAGQSALLLRQLPTLIRALQDYRDAVGCFPASWDMDRALGAARGEDLFERDIDGDWHTLRAERDVVVGSLRAAASRLVVQQVQIQAGVNKMYDGVKSYSVYRVSGRRNWPPNGERLSEHRAARQGSASRRHQIYEEHGGHEAR